MELTILIWFCLASFIAASTSGESSTDIQSGDATDNDQAASISSLYMFPDFLDFQDAPVQSDGSGLDDSEFHNFLGKFLVVPEDEEANILENSFDGKHRVEDPHFRSQVSYAGDGTKVVQYEPKDNSPAHNGTQLETRNETNSNQGGPATNDDIDPLKQGLQVSYAADGTKIIQHAPTQLPPNKYNRTTPAPGPKPTLSIHYGIQYPKPNTTKTIYYLKDGTRITQFNTGIKDDNGTMKPKWSFLPDEYVPGFSDDDGQPNAAGYKYRNREGEQEKGRLIKEQIDEATKENNPTYQYKAEENIVNSLRKPSNNGSNSRSVQPGELPQQNETQNRTAQAQPAISSSNMGANNIGVKAMSVGDTGKQTLLGARKTKKIVGKPSKVVHTVLYDVRPLKPNHYQPLSVDSSHPIEAGSKRGEGGHSKTTQGSLKTSGSKHSGVKGKRKKRKHGKFGKSKKKATSRLVIMPLPDDQKETVKKVGNNESDFRQALQSLVFKNEPGVVRKKQNFAYISQCGLYTEPQNVSQVQHAWATKTYSPYFYLYEKPKNYEQCKPSPWMNGTDMRGNVFISFEVKSIHGSNMENNAKICQKYCCKEPRCAAWVMRKQAAATANCPKDSFCCWLKTAVPKREPNEDATSGIIQRERYRHPPTGMRSAVPLGGLGTGSFELRADGTFHEWTIENQSPGGAAKLSKTALDLMLLAVRVEQDGNHKSAVLRTHAPHGFDGVDKMSYYGSYPVSKLDVDLPQFKDIKMSLYAHSSLKPRDPKASSVPAVTFSLNVENPTDEEAIVAFLLNVPLGYNDDTIRRGGNYAEVAFTRLVTAADCMNACAKQGKCMSWTTNGPFSCLLKDNMPLNSYEFGIISGLKGRWTADGQTLTMKRPGFFAQSGETSLRVVGQRMDEIQFVTTNHPEKVWKTFKKFGNFGNTTLNATALHGTAMIKARVPAGKSRTLPIILSWYYPNRDIADERVGNYYSKVFKSSEDVATYVENHMTEQILDIVKFQSSFVPPKSIFPKESKASMTCDPIVNGINMLPECLQDILMNSLSFWRSGMWMENGRWRQWEAFDCVNFDPVHVDFHRFLPYIIFYPELAKNVMRSWAEHQLVNGMIQESLSQGCLEETSREGVGGGRTMTDVNVAFVVQTYLIYMWTNDTEFFDDMYPVAMRALTWLIKDAARGTDLPYRKPDTYDLFELDKYDHCAYNSILTKLALRAGEEMALMKNDLAHLDEIGTAFDKAHVRFEIEMWDDKDGFYHAWFDAEWGSPSWIMSDSFYGQVWAYTLGLGDLVDKQKLKSHLLKERERNDTPFGLKAISRRESEKITQEDTSVILGEEPGCKSLENITKYESIWMTASTDWSTLMVNLDMPPKIALHQAEKSLNHYRSTLKDQWNFHGLTSSEHYGLDGLPWATSHYSFHLMLWHLPLALSGQQYNAPNASLTFQPKFDVPYWLSFYTPVALGNIEAKYSESKSETMFKFTVTSGKIRLRNLSVSGSKYGKGEFEIGEGQSIEWSAPSKKSDKNKDVKELLSELKR